MKYSVVEVPEQTAYIIPIADLHVGDKAFNGEGREKLKGYLEWVKQRPNARIFLNGDIFNVASRISKTDPFSTDTNEYMEAIELFKPYKDQIIGCVSDDTYCLTRRGWLLLRECSTDDEVLAFDDKKDCFKYQKIEKVFEYDYSGKVFHVKNQNLDFIVSPEHRIIYKPEWSNKKSKWKWGKIDSQFRVKRADEFFKSSIGHYQIPIASGFYSGNNELSNQELSLLGWIIAEGTMPEGRNDIQLYQSTRNQWKLDIILDTLNKVGIDYKIYKHKGKGVGEGHYGNQKDWVTIWISAKQSKKFRSILNSKKRIPAKILQEYSSDKLEVIFNSLVLGDGRFGKNKTSGAYYSSDEELAKDFLELAIKTKRRAKLTHRLKYGKFDEYCVNFSDDLGSTLHKKHICTEDYNGKIYSLKVKSTFYLAMRNGKPFITGNCTDGNHEARMLDMFGVSPTQHFCLALGIPYFGWSALIRLKVNKRPDNRWRENYFLYFHHTTAGGSTIGSKLNRVIKLRDIVEGVDVYFGSHNHQLVAAPQDVYYPSIQGGLKKRRIWYVDCGSYLEWNGSYAEKGMMAPTKLGSPRVRFNGLKHDVHVSL